MKLETCTWVGGLGYMVKKENRENIWPNTADTLNKVIIYFAFHLLLFTQNTMNTVTLPNSSTKICSIAAGEAHTLILTGDRLTTSFLSTIPLLLRPVRIMRITISVTYCSFYEIIADLFASDKEI